jgi:hypothetical protein
VKTHDDLAVAAGHSVDPARWLDVLDELMDQVAGRFSRVEPRRRARALVLGAAGGPAAEELLDDRRACG